MPTKQPRQPKIVHRLVLGIDPGISNTVFALVQCLPSRYYLFHSGVIYTSPRAPLGYRFDAHNSTNAELLTEFISDLVS